MGKLFKIDTNLQRKNVISKNELNLVSKITDTVNHIACTQNVDINKPVYNYDGYYEFNGSSFLYNYNIKDKLHINTRFAINNWILIPWVTGYANEDLPICGTITPFSPTTGNGAWFYGLAVDENGLLTVKFNFFNTDQTVTTVVSNPVNTIISYDTLHNIELRYYLGEFFIIIDGLLTEKINPAATPQSKINQKFYIGYNPESDTYLNGNIKSLDIRDDNMELDPFTTYGTRLFNEPEPFIYYKTHQDDGFNKFFITSKFLEDSNFNGSNIIDIKDEFSNGFFSNYDSSVVKIHDSGLLFNGSGALANTENSFDNGAATTFTELLICGWFNVTSTNFQYLVSLSSHSNSTTHLTTRTNLIEIMYNSAATAKFSLYNWGTGTQLNSTVPVILGKYYHIAAIYKNGEFFLFINGILDAKSGPLAINTADRYLLMDIGENIRYFGYPTFGLIDDVLFRTEDSIIDPTGYAIGNTVFKKPAIGSLDNEFIQYPIP